MRLQESPAHCTTTAGRIYTVQLRPTKGHSWCKEFSPNEVALQTLEPLLEPIWIILWAISLGHFSESLIWAIHLWINNL